MEIWKDIEGYEGLYKISSSKQVKSFHKGKERIRKPFESDYSRIVLSKNKEIKTFLLHVLLAKAFIPNPNNYPCVNHKDENKLNNYIHVNDDGTVDPDKSNLEWVTFKENINYGTRTERASKARINHPKRSTKVLMSTKDGEPIKVFPSQAEAARQTGLSQGNIWAACTGRRKTAGGYIWIYV